MTKPESIIIKIVMGITCPILMLLIFFWLTGAFNIYVAILPNCLNITMVLLGFIFGCSLDVLYLHQWAENFYKINHRLAIAIYFFLFIVAFGIFMGFPIGTFTLGIAAGLYTGRRGYYNQMTESQFALILRKVAFLTSLFTFIAALPIGILGLSEPIVTRFFKTLFGLDKTSTQGIIGCMLMGLCCFGLFIMQYWVNILIGCWAFKTGNKHTNSLHESCLPVSRSQ